MNGGKPWTWRTRVRFVDTDASQRIHYTAMFRYFEAAEQELLRELGCGYGADGIKEIGFPRVHVECDLTSEVRYDDVVELAVSVERVGTSSFTLAYAASVEGRPAARGRVVVVCLDKATGRARAMPELMGEALRRRGGV
jgi:YbgC/YbaW family acyl-CoA thioester hydrolase